MYPYNPVMIGLRSFQQLLQIRSNIFRLSFTENAEDLRRFHPYLFIRIMQEFLKHRHMFPIDGGRVRGDVFGCPDKRQPDVWFLIRGEAEQARPKWLNHRIAAATDPAKSVYRPLPQKWHQTVKEGTRKTMNRSQSCVHIIAEKNVASK